jgi:hypothetical protein
MSTTLIIVLVAMAAIYGGIFYFMQIKKKKQAEMFLNTNFSAEMNKAAIYKSNFLKGELSFISEQMEGKIIDAFNYASLNYTTKDSIKDSLKDSFKGMATLGTVRFHSVQTPKYLVLSGDDLHLFDTDTDGEISSHFVFKPARLLVSSITEIPLEGTIKAYARQKGDQVKAFRISLATDESPIELILFSALLFSYPNTGLSAFSLNVQKNLEEIIIGNDFLKKLGNRYPNLRVSALVA